jgi:acyl-CoA thioester hydrolase
MSLEGKLKIVVKTKIPYQDSDPAGVAWHGNYFRYFDLARCALLDEFGYGYKEMEKAGHVWPIIDASVRYIQPVRFDDEIEIEALLVETEYRLKIKYLVRDSIGKIVTKGMTTQVAVELATGELCIGSPQILLDRLAAYESGLTMRSVD